MEIAAENLVGKGAMNDLMREYERVRYPADRRLDLQGEGPRSARERALHWIQSRAHESPGQELLVIVERGRAVGRPPTPMATSVRGLLDDLQGKLIDWWQPFTPGSFAIRVATRPRVDLPAPVREVEPNDGRTASTSGAARPSPLLDIPEELLGTARATAELRIYREGLTMRAEEIVLREIWVEAQARAMDRRISFSSALAALHDEEQALFRRLED